VTDQLALWEPEPVEPLMFIPICGRCERAIARIPVDDGPDGWHDAHPWHAAALWSWVALAEHEHDCRKEPEG
jgi:hypothetical protein